MQEKEQDNKVIREQIQKLEEDIGSVEVQGATNVALATLEGMRLAAQLKTENGL